MNEPLPTEPPVISGQLSVPAPNVKPVDPVLTDEEAANIIQAKDAKVEDPELQVRPKSNCKHCYGRGYEGTSLATGKKIVCRCVQRSFKKVNALKKARDAKLKAAKITSQSGWDAPKAPVGDPNAATV